MLLVKDMKGPAYVCDLPYRCLIPKGFRNLLVACRGAGFSAIAASSCRLSRCMMQLGQAAGNAVALGKELGTDLAAVPADSLRDRLRREHVQLDWPLPADLVSYLQNAETENEQKDVSR